MQSLRCLPPGKRDPNLRGKHGQQAGPAANVQYNLVLEEMLVVDHGVPVRVGPHAVLDHLFVNPKVRVAVEVVVLGCRLGRHDAAQVPYRLAAASD